MNDTGPPAFQIPSGAVWDPERAAWEVAQRDQDGRRQGESRLLAPDGTLREVCHYEADVRSGPFVAYHPNGDVARRGFFDAGLIHGAFVARATDGPTTETLRACCVPETAWELRARYVRGQPVREVFHDRAGRPLLSSGALQPTPPAGVPAEAELDEGAMGEGVPRWVHGHFDDVGDRVGQHRSWTLDGRLAEVSEYDQGRLTARRSYDVAAAESTPPLLLEECELADDLLHGAYRRRFSAAANPYADERVREERGAFDAGRPCGRWRFLDDRGVELAANELGSVVDEERVSESPAFAWKRGDAASAATWWRLAGDLKDEGRVREALCAAARGAACGVDAGDAAVRLAAFLSDNTIALAPEVRRQRGAELSDSSQQTMTSALDALITGVEPAAAFRTLASVLPSAHPAALDFVNAALLLGGCPRIHGHPPYGDLHALPPPPRGFQPRPLAVAHWRTHLTRALIRIEQGDDQGAREDAAEVAREDPGAANSLLAHMRPYFPDFSPDFSAAAGFWPAREEGDLASLSEEGHDEGHAPAQPLAAVRHMVQVYATRLGRLRAMVRARTAPRTPEPVWLPPDTSPLLPDGPVALRRLTIAVPAEAGSQLGPEQAPGERPFDELHIDEELALRDEGLTSVADLLAAARADWSALGWLCWSCGLDRVALPVAVAPPSSFGAAVARAVSRCYRLHDRMITGGVRGLSQGLPGFLWEGIDVDHMPHHVARIAAGEYLEIRSMFLWLMLSDALSPFQSDLREA